MIHKFKMLDNIFDEYAQESAEQDENGYIEIDEMEARYYSRTFLGLTKNEDGITTQVFIGDPNAGFFRIQNQTTHEIFYDVRCSPDEALCDFIGTMFPFLTELPLDKRSARNPAAEFENTIVIVREYNGVSVSRFNDAFDNPSMDEFLNGEDAGHVREFKDSLGLRSFCLKTLYASNALLPMVFNYDRSILL
jgi:hypothetical protein